MAVEAELSPRRDYSLVGRDTQLAVERGLAAAQWYHTEVPRQTMKELMQRSDAAAIRDTLIWLGAMVVTATKCRICECCKGRSHSENRQKAIKNPF